MAKPRTPKPSKLSDEEYEALLHDLQVQLVRFQRDVIAHDEKVLLIMEGRDGAGKDGTIKRIVEHLSPRETRVAALPKPSEREKTQWYFQRFAAHLPAGGEFVIFIHFGFLNNRSCGRRHRVGREKGWNTTVLGGYSNS